jgi:hypothetical protein
MINYYPPYSIRISVFLALVMCNIGTMAYAATGNFTLNFQPIPSERFSEPEWLNFSCNRGRGGGDFEDCDDNDEFRDNNGRDRTPFLMERLRGDNGDEYYHVIIGSPGDDFIQESYIKITSLFCGRDDDCDDLGPISDSLGESRDITERRNNAYDPLGPASFSGSGTANPTSTLFRQILTDSSNGMRQEFLKASFNEKHLLTFTLDADFIDLDFRLNMTNSTFSDAGTAGIIELHTLNNTDPSFAGIPDPDSNILPTLPPSSNAFDIATDGDVNDVSGGKYEYVSHGVYSGEGAGFDIFSADWDDFFDPAQNIGHLYGPENDDD